MSRHAPRAAGHARSAPSSHRTVSVAVLALLIIAACDRARSPVAPDEANAGSMASTANTLAAPSNLVVTATSSTMILATWKDNSKTESGFELMRSNGDSASGPYGVVATSDPNATSIGEGGLDPQEHICYAVRAFQYSRRGTAYSALSTPACTTTPLTPGAPAAPSGVAAVSPDSRTVVVTWKDNSSDERRFLVERGPAATGPFGVVFAVDSNVTTVRDSGRTAETMVCYRLRAENGALTSPWSAAGCAIPLAPPTALSAAASGAAVVLSWSDNSASEDGYEVLRADSVRGPFSAIGVAPAGATSFTDAGAGMDVARTYRVRATRAGGYSDPSNDVTFVLASGPPAAPAIVDLSPSGGWATWIEVRDNATNEAGFRLERSIDGGPWVTLSTLSPNQPSTWDWNWAQGSMTPEMSFCYRITAFNSAGEASDTGCTALPQVPPLLDFTFDDDGTVVLNWADVSNVEDGYIIVRADAESMGMYYDYDRVPANTTTYHDLNTVPGGWYAYYLKSAKGMYGYLCCSSVVNTLPYAAARR